MMNKKLVLQLLAVIAFTGTQVNADFWDDARRALDPNENGLAESARATGAAIQSALDPNQNGVAQAFTDYGNAVAASFKTPTNTTVGAIVGGVPVAELKELNTRNATAPIIKIGNCKLILNNLTGKTFTLHQHSYATGSLNTDVLPVNGSTLDLKIGEQYFLLLSDGSKIFIKLTASNAIDSYVLSSAVFNTGTMTQSYNFSNLYLFPSASSTYALLAN